MSDEISVIEADLADLAHQRDYLSMMDAYVLDPMEGGVPLPSPVRNELISELRKHPAHFLFLAYAANKPIAFSLCFLGFSSFAARPLLNVHDIGVVEEQRGKGVGLALMKTTEIKARELRCCKITLEVRKDNDRAPRLYRRLGFSQSAVGDERVPQEFWSKSL